LAGPVVSDQRAILRRPHGKLQEGKTFWNAARTAPISPSPQPSQPFKTGSKGDWLEALLFAVAVAVGLTPEMLPMIVTMNLAKGAMAMARKKVIVKRLNSYQLPYLLT
jgi:hypothetical protein